MINWLVCVMDNECIYCVVESGFLTIIYIKFHHAYLSSYLSKNCSNIVHIQRF